MQTLSTYFFVNRTKPMQAAGQNRRYNNFLFGIRTDNNIDISFDNYVMLYRNLSVCSMGFHSQINVH